MDFARQIHHSSPYNLHSFPLPSTRERWRTLARAWRRRQEWRQGGRARSAGGKPFPPLVVDRAGQRASFPLEADPPRWAVSSPLVADPAGRLASSLLVAVPIRRHLSAAMAKQHRPHPWLHPVRPNPPYQRLH
jgi:hypothetical protein